ncbi:MAG: hypothetical protein M3N68_04660 [Actinomycetota bacterium]|nr:hypothetical protein [Actinomycetota bacterium]
MVAALTRLAGAELELLVLAGAHRGCAAVDLGTGALVHAHWPEGVPPLTPFTLARGRLADEQEDRDPVRPEAVALSTAPCPVGRIPGRRAERWLRPLLHPPGEHLLGFAGTATPYWALSGDRPSVALVSPASRPIVVGNRCRFRWRNAVHTLPVLATALPFAPAKPRRLLVSLSAPVAGHCYKVVAGLLPRQ